MGNTIGIGGGSKRTTKIMNTKGETTKLKTPIKAMEITKDHPGHVLLESESVRHFGIRAKPLDPTQFLEPKRVYFLVELPKFPVDHDREPRRVRSGGIHMGAKERLESLVLSKRSISDLSIMKPSGSVVVDEAAEGAVRVKLRLPKAEVERLMKESKNKTEAAEKIMDLYMGSSCSETGSDTVSVSGSEKSGFGSPEHVPHLRRQVRRGKSPLSGVPEGYKVTQEEIKAALFSIGDNKAPGPDGYNAHFYKAAWSIVQDDFFNAITDFFGSGRMLKQINHASISLIAKCDNPEAPSDYRPISCCNVTYKTIAKVLATRLNSVLHTIIGPYQSAFVSNRSIKNNVLICQELLHKYNQKHISPRVAIKVDVTKAFDTIDHDFIIHCLTSMGFPLPFIGLIRECITTASYSVNINGSLKGHFKGTRGLRQGCPLSPPLFTIAIEYLSQMIGLNTTSPNFRLHPKCRSPRITHLCFADDLMLFCRGDMQSVSILKSTLDSFGLLSGLKVNSSKSAIFMGGISSADQRNLSQVAGFNIGTLPFIYLGLPVGSRRLAIIDYLPLIHKITKRIQSWNAKLLSYAGRIQLISSVLMALHQYWSSILLLPNAIITKIQSMIRSFLWSGKETSKRALVAWNTVCTPKKDGGLGFPDILARNKSCLTRHIFDIDRNLDNLWVSWISSNLLKNNTIWDCQAKPHHSHYWKALLSIRDELPLPSDGSNVISSISSNGNFDPKKAYIIFRSPNIPPPIAFNQIIWSKFIVPKCSCIAWIACLRRLPTLTKLHQWNLVDSPTCLLCSSRPEDDDHLWTGCSYTSLVLDIISRWGRVPYPAPYALDLWQWLHQHPHPKNNLLLAARVAAVVAAIYFVWKARNNLAHNKVFTRALDCANETIRAAKLHLSHHWKDRSSHSLATARMLEIALI